MKRRRSCQSVSTSRELCRGVISGSKTESPAVPFSLSGPGCDGDETGAMSDSGSLRKELVWDVRDGKRGGNEGGASLDDDFLLGVSVSTVLLGLVFLRRKPGMSECSKTVTDHPTSGKEYSGKRGKEKG